MLYLPSYFATLLTRIQINFDKLATMGNFKNAKSANTSWLTVKKKLLAGSESDNGAANSVASTLATEASNGTVADDEASPPVESPKKVGRKPPATESERIDVAPQNGQISATPSKKRGRKPKDPNATPRKRVKQGVKTEPTEIVTQGAAHTQIQGESSIFGDGPNGKAHIKDEEQAITAEQDERVNSDNACLGFAV